jgi:phosphate-selective porin OprO and OprP
MKNRDATLSVLSLFLLSAGLCFAQDAQKPQKLDQALSDGAGLPAGTAIEQRMSKMEGLLKQQDQEITALRKQLANQDEGRLNKARAEEIRQIVKDILCDPKFRNEIYQPTLQAGYDHGFFIRTADDCFYLKTRIRTQFRYTGEERQERNRNLVLYQPIRDKNSFEWERLRLYFTGWIWEKNFQYVMYLDASTNTGEGNVKAGDIYFDYQYAKDQKIQWGQFLVPFGKQGVNASTYNQMFVDYSVAHAVFQPGQGIGIMPHGDVLNKKMTYMVGVFNGLKNATDDAALLDTKMAVVSRLEYHVLPGYDEVDETDLAYHEKPALDVAGSFLYNQNDGDIGGGNGRNRLVYTVEDLIRAGRGGYGLSPDVGSEIVQLGADIGFKYKGFSITGEYYFRHVDSDHFWSPWNRLTAGGRGTDSPQGGYVQAGYFVIPKKLEVAGRLSGVWGMGDKCMEQALGVNYYLKGQALKLSADITHIDEVPVTNPVLDIYQNDKDVWLYRLQIQATMD